MDKEPTCYGCKYLIDTFGNYLECGLSAKEGEHMFVDYFYWNDGCPDKCPIKDKGSKRGKGDF